MNLRFTLSNDILGTEILQTSPKGWDEMAISIVRDPILHGMSMEFPVALESFCDAGRAYLLNAYKVLGIDAQVTMSIQMSCGCSDNELDAPDYSIDYSDDYGSMSGSNDCVWSEITSGLIDMKGIKTNTNYVSYSLIQSTEHQKFKARYDNKVDTNSSESLDGEEVPVLAPFETTLHNKGITLISNWDIGSEASYVFFDPPEPSDPYDRFYFHTPPFLTTINFINTGYDLGINIGSFAQDLPDIFENITPFTRKVRFKGRIKVELVLGSCSTYIQSDFYIGQYLNVDMSGNPIWIGGLINLDSTNVCAGGSRDRDFAINEEFTLVPNAKVKLYAGTDTGDTTGGGAPVAYLYDFVNSGFSATGEIIIPESTTKNYPIHEASSLVAQRILSNDDCFYSELFGRKNSWPNTYSANGCDSFTILANGLNIRGKNYDECTIKLSLKDIFEGLSPIYNLGLGLKKLDGQYKIVLDSKESFYDNEVLFRLSNVPNIETSLMTDYFFSEMRFGYSNWETEEVSGIDEINTKRYYNTGIKAVSNILEKISPFIASGYSIQLTRQKQFFDDGTDEDYKNDNETFIICTNREVDGNGVPVGLDQSEKAENFADSTGIQFFDSSYNLRISPERNKLRYAPIISSCLLKYPARECKFTYGEGNYEASYRGTDECDVFNNQILAGNQNVAWDSVNITNNDPIWNPIVDEFEFPISVSQMKLLIDFPEKAIEYSDSESDYIKGYILISSIKVVNGMTKFKIIRDYD